MHYFRRNDFPTKGVCLKSSPTRCASSFFSTDREMWTGTSVDAQRVTNRQVILRLCRRRTCRNGMEFWDRLLDPVSSPAVAGSGLVTEQPAHKCKPVTDFWMYCGRLILKPIRRRRSHGIPKSIRDRGLTWGWTGAWRKGTFELAYDIRVSQYSQWCRKKNCSRIEPVIASKQ